MAHLERLPHRLSLWADRSRLRSWPQSTLGMAIAAPAALRGHYCQGDCVGYPYADVAAYSSRRDYLWMYPAIVLTLLIIVLVQCIHYEIEPSRRVLSGIGLTLSAIDAGTLIIDYAVRLGFLPAGRARR